MPIKHSIKRIGTVDMWACWQDLASKWIHTPDIKTQLDLGSFPNPTRHGPGSAGDVVLKANKSGISVMKDILDLQFAHLYTI